MTGPGYREPVSALLALVIAIALVDGGVYLAAREAGMTLTLELAGQTAEGLAGQLEMRPPEDAALVLAEAERRGLGRLTLFSPAGEVLAGHASPRPAELGVVLTGRSAERRSGGESSVQVLQPVGRPGRPRAVLQVELDRRLAGLPGWGWVAAHAAAVAAAVAGVWALLVRRSVLLPMAQELAQERARAEAQVERLEVANAALREAQEALIQSERLAGVGRLAAGLAHELGNPLTAVRSYLEVMRLEVPSAQKSGLGDLVQRCSREVERMHVLLRDMLDFSRPGRPFQRVDMAALLRDLEQSLPLLPVFRGVRLEVVEAPVEAWGDPGRLRQAVLNLARNAAEAGAARVRLSAARREGGGVVVRCEDDGAGIPEENLGRLFEPFFTTRPTGQGTGLGLWVVHQVLEQHGGWVEVESRVGEGATFCLHLPSEGQSD